jgi:heme exporter protein A
LPGLYDDLTASENLLFATRMLGLPPTVIPGALRHVGIGRYSAERVRGFSAGMQRRLALARLLLASPALLLLDEPYSNLDSDGVALINATIEEVKRRNGAAIVVLHETAPALPVLDRCISLLDGRAMEHDSAARWSAQRHQPARTFTGGLP